MHIVMALADLLLDNTGSFHKDNNIQALIVAMSNPFAKAYPRGRAYVKNHGLGFEVPYRFDSETRKYLPDFIVLVDDDHGSDDLLRLVVEIKGYRREDAKEKKSTTPTGSPA